MKEVINNNNKYKLKYLFAMLYIQGRKFMTGSVFTLKTLFLANLSKFGCQFLCAQKWLLISKMSCITPRQTRSSIFYFLIDMNIYTRNLPVCNSGQYTCYRFM